MHTACRALAAGGLTLVDVELLPTHGGSSRLWARPEQVAGPPTPAVAAILAAEDAAGLSTVRGHRGFRAAVDRVRADLLGFLLEVSAAGRTVVGYGAPGKGNTLLNYYGIRTGPLSYPEPKITTNEHDPMIIPRQPPLPMNDQG